MSRTILALALCLAALLIPASASGVWGGEVDSTNRYAQVGAMYYDYLGTDTPLVDGLVCSGSYGGRSTDGEHDVFLLAGHCPAGFRASDLYVSFSSNVSVTNTHTPVMDPIEVDEYVQMPGFGHDAGDPRDLAVLLLPAGRVTGIAPVKLAPQGYLDSLNKRSELKFRRITLVGYGFQPDWSSPGPTTFSSDGKRRTGPSVITGLGKATVRFQQNNGIGTGSGACIGDSGSPQIDEDAAPAVVVSVMSGGNGQCNSVNVNYRVDTAQARAFLDDYLELPESP